MRNYIKPSANVIELAVKERLSRTRDEQRTYRVKIGNNTYRDESIMTRIYAATGISTIDYKEA